jgi:hypothetical protein
MVTWSGRGARELSDDCALVSRAVVIVVVVVVEVVVVVVE